MPEERNEVVAADEVTPETEPVVDPSTEDTDINDRSEDAATKLPPESLIKATGRPIADAKDTGGISFDSICIGDQYDVLDSSNRWCEAEVCKKDYLQRRIYVTYTFWEKKFDEWISSMERIRRLHTFTYTEGGVLRACQRVEVMDECKQWLEAFIEEEGVAEVKVHYKGYHPKFDEWLPRTSDRIRPYGRFKSLAPKRKEVKQWKVPGMPRTVTGNLLLAQHSQNGNSLKQPYHPNGRHAVDSYYSTYNETDSYQNNDCDERDGRRRKISELSDQYVRYKSALESQQLRIAAVSGDGNCLFRSVAHQVYGDDSFHGIVREKCLDYMELEAEFFSQFVEGGIDLFPLYLEAKRRDACWGDDPEIEAICELYNRPAEIWAFDHVYGAKKLRTFHESAAFSGGNQEQTFVDGNNLRVSSFRGSFPINGMQPSPGPLPAMKLSYYGGGHYDSIMDENYGRFLLSSAPGLWEDHMIAQCRERIRTSHNRRSVEQEIRQRSDQEATEQMTLDFAIQASHREQMTQIYDDIETCLMLSMQQQSADSVNDLVIKSAQEQSEREYLEKIMVESTSHGRSDFKKDLDEKLGDFDVTEDILRRSEEDLILEQMKKESMDEYQKQSAQQQGFLDYNDSSCPSDTKQTSNEQANATKKSDGKLSENSGANELDMALKLSEMSEQEVYEFALKQSMMSDAKTTPDYFDFKTEEELLQLALLESTQSIGASERFYLMDSETDAACDDEDLLRAIEESLRR